MGKNRISGPDLESPFAQPEELWDGEHEWSHEGDRAGALLDEAAGEAVLRVECWGTSPPAKRVPLNAEALSRAFEMFPEVDVIHSLLLAHRPLARPHQELMTIARSEYESLISRIAAIEAKTGIRPDSPHTQITDELATSVAQLAKEAFAVENATCQIVESDGEPCLLVSVYVGSNAIPAEMSTRKTELHRRAIDLSSPAPRLRVKVIYG